MPFTGGYSLFITLRGRLFWIGGRTDATWVANAWEFVLGGSDWWVARPDMARQGYHAVAWVYNDKPDNVLTGR